MKKLCTFILSACFTLSAYADDVIATGFRTIPYERIAHDNNGNLLYCDNALTRHNQCLDSNDKNAWRPVSNIIPKGKKLTNVQLFQFGTSGVMHLKVVIYWK